MHMTQYEFRKKLNVENICEDLIIRLKSEQLPLIMWGCGDVADAVFKYLQYNNINISQVWVDNWSGKQKFHGLIPNSIEAISKEFHEFNVILGHSHYEKGKKIKEFYPQIKNVFYVFSVHYEQYKKISYNEIEEVEERFIQLYDCLADNDSRENLLVFLKTKLTGNADYIINRFSQEMSFFNNDVFTMTDHEVFLDIGAYNGDTIREFIVETDNKYEKIIAIEPDIKNYIELNKYLASNCLKNIIPSMIGAWNCIEQLSFNTGNEQISSIAVDSKILLNSEKLIVYASPIDNIFGEEKITFIKINYFEGVKEALEGLEKIICKNLPKLAVTVGFDIYNILKISEYIIKLNIGYKVYLRFNRAMSSTFTLYAIVPN